MDIKAKIEEVVKKVQADPSVASNFEKEPVKTVEGIIGVDLPDDVIEQVVIFIKYEGYIERQMILVNRFKKNEKRVIPADIDYDDVSSLRLEARQKLKQFRPENVGQASRISGVTPADVSVLLIYLSKSNDSKD